jgi:hypothetical protein
MKQLTFAVPNSVAQVLYEIEHLRGVGRLSELSCRLLEMFYVTGWDDGFVQFVRRDLCAALGSSKTDINRARAELESLRLVVFRIAERYEVAEIVALSTPTVSGAAEICWWQYYRVHFADFWFDVSDKSGGDAQKGDA